MDKLEHYLDQVCRGIGGPRALRQHVRQKLREHLLDAAAEHRAAGLSEGEALDRALADFGGPDDVRSELEATHGHRLLPVVIDKALQWKERTMRAKWLWMTWAFLALPMLIALEVLFLTFNVVFIIPKYQKLVHDGMIDAAEIEQHGMGWTDSLLRNLSHVGGHYTTQLLLLAAAAWGLFEWRVKSENKPFMRLAALGTVAVGLMVAVALTAGSLVVTFTMAMPAYGRMTRPWAVEQVTTVVASVSGMEQALAKKDWAAMQEPAEQISNAITRLSVGPAVTSLTRGNESALVDELRRQLQEASDSFREARQAIRDKDAERLKKAMARFHDLFGPIAQAAKQGK
jgi:hypothetical protein